MSAPLRLLMTGFEPFGGEPLNPSWELVSALSGEPAHEDVELSIARLPVDAERYRPALDETLDAARPEAVVAVGQATRRGVVHLKTLARNRMEYGDQVDNAGQVVRGRPVVTVTAAELLSTLPLAELA